jgi:hypothetical protein
MGVRAVLSLLFILLMAPPFSIAAGPSTLNTPELMVVYDEALDQTAQQVLSAYPSIKQTLESMFQWPLNFRPTLVLINNQKNFSNWQAMNLWWHMHCQKKTWWLLITQR